MGAVSKFTRWHKRPFAAALPPICDPVTGIWAEQSADKHTLFHQAFTNPGYAASDLDNPLLNPVETGRPIEFPALSETEVRDCCIKVTSTTPGQDGISVDLLKAAWPQLSSYITQLFQACLDTGHHPAAFRSARVVVIPKPDDRDRTLPRSYRPISLLSVLGKGLERVVVKRLASLALSHQMVGAQQCGALPRRSAVDLISALTHDVETAWSLRHTCSLLTLDIQGAFDAIYPGRLRYRLAEQGWPLHIVDWVYSFCTQRFLRYDVDGSLSAPFFSTRGIPQGSPISPILFLLYTAPIHKLPLKASVFGYADDLALLTHAQSVTTCMADLQHDLSLLLTWASDNALSFDPAKSELLHLTRKAQSFGDNPDLTLTLPTGQYWATTATPRHSSMRWLGIWFDRRLSFAQHVSKSKRSALRAAGAIRGLGNTIKGASPAVLRGAALACVLPVLFYGAETWWSVPDNQPRQGPVRLITTAVNRVLAASARAILPVWRTTPVPILLREAGIPNASAWLKYITQRHALRIHRLDRHHPLSVRVRHLPQVSLVTTRLSRALDTIPETEQVHPDTRPPWVTLTPYSALREMTGYRSGERPDQALAFLRWYTALPGTDMVLFSDGSRLAPGKTGGGWIGYHQYQQVPSLTGHGPLGDTAEVPDAEAIAALGALLTAQSSPLLPFVTKIHVCLDNLQTAITASDAHSALFASSAQFVYRQIRQVISQLPCEVFFRWCPGHCKITGNEAADATARAAADRPQPVHRRLYTHAAVKRMIKEQLWQSANTSWHNWLRSADRTYSGLALEADKPPKELTLARPALALLLAARSGHGDFADYHIRFNHEDAVLTCSCGALKAPTHFFYCPNAQPRILPGKHPGQALPFLLGSYKGAQQFAEWIKSSQFYITTCPRR